MQHGFERLVLFKVNMGDSRFFYCGVVVGVLVFTGLGFVCLYYGNNCKNAELRANHTHVHVWKDIHNDVSAKALQAFGWIFSIPFIIALLAATVFVMCLPCILSQSVP